jgi:cytochrome c
MFDKIILPHSGPNLDLMSYLLILATIIYLLYAGLLFGSAALSVFFNFFSKKNKLKEYYTLAHDYSELITGNKIIIIGLGIVPLLSIIIIYSEILKDSGSQIPLLLLFSLSLFVIGAILIYSYKKSLQNTEIFTSVMEQSPDASSEARSEWLALKELYEKLSSQTGVWGIIFLFLSSWAFCSNYNLSLHISEQTSRVQLLFAVFSLETAIKFILLLCSALALTMTTYLMRKYFADKELFISDESNFVYKFNIWGTFVLCSLLPILFVLNLILIPNNLLSSTLFIIFLLALIGAFLLLHFLYNMIKEHKYGNIRYSFYLLLAVFILVIINEQVTFNVASEKQIYSLSINYDKLEKAELEKAGLTTVKISGEDIYQSKCTACHRFKEKLTGPPHIQVMLKYEKDHDAMINFILNPLKVDPAYPSMPSQGLKPAEAKAVVDYMYEHFGKELH